jgi:hypothetical protein
MSKILKILEVVLFSVFLMGVASIAEEITLTTYYPAPYGNYEELQASKLAVGSGTTMPTTDGRVNIATTGTGTGGILQVGGTTTADCEIYAYTETGNYGLLANFNHAGVGAAVCGYTSGLSSSSSGVIGRTDGETGNGIWGIGGGALTYAGYFQGGKGVLIAGNLEVTGNLEVSGDITKISVPYIHPDYVFESGYELMPLSQLKNFVLKERRLPNMPSKEDIINDGVKLFEHNRLLLEKLEEAYLYIFELEKRISALEKNNK